MLKTDILDAVSVLPLYIQHKFS